MNNYISIASSKELSVFCHELSKHTQLPASGIKSAIAKMKGFAHVSTYNDALDAGDTSMSASQWVADFSSSVNDRKDTWHIRSKSLLFFMLNCINHNKEKENETFSAIELFDLCSPKAIVSAACEVYEKSNSDDVKKYISNFIDSFPGGDCSKIFNLHKNGNDKDFRGQFFVFMEQLGYLTSQVEPYLRDKIGWKLY